MENIDIVTLSNSVGDLLSKYKDDCGLSNNDIAYRADIHKDTFLNMLNKKGYELSLLDFIKVALALDITNRDILSLFYRDKMEASFEDIYYRENAKVGLLSTEIDALKAQIAFLESKITFMNKYKV